MRTAVFGGLQVDKQRKKAAKVKPAYRLYFRYFLLSVHIFVLLSHALSSHLLSHFTRAHLIHLLWYHHLILSIFTHFSSIHTHIRHILRQISWELLITSSEVLFFFRRYTLLSGCTYIPSSLSHIFNTHDNTVWVCIFLYILYILISKYTNISTHFYIIYT